MTGNITTIIWEGLFPDWRSILYCEFHYAPTMGYLIFIFPASSHQRNVILLEGVIKLWSITIDLPLFISMLKRAWVDFKFMSTWRSTIFVYVHHLHHCAAINNNKLWFSCLFIILMNIWVHNGIVFITHLYDNTIFYWVNGFSSHQFQ